MTSLFLSLLLVLFFSSDDPNLAATVNVCSIVLAYLLVTLERRVGMNHDWCSNEAWSFLSRPQTPLRPLLISLSVQVHSALRWPWLELSPLHFNQHRGPICAFHYGALLYEDISDNVPTLYAFPFEKHRIATTLYSTFILDIKGRQIYCLLSSSLLRIRCYLFIPWNDKIRKHAILQSTWWTYDILSKAWKARVLFTNYFY